MNWGITEFLALGGGIAMGHERWWAEGGKINKYYSLKLNNIGLVTNFKCFNHRAFSFTHKKKLYKD